LKTSWLSGRRRSSRGDVGTRASVGPSLVAGIPPPRRRADDSGCPEDAEEGNVVAHAPQSSCTRRRHERSLHALGRRVLRSVLRPVRCRSSLCTRRLKALRGGATVRHHGWVNPREWEEPALGLDVRTLRGSPRVTASGRERAWHVDKEGGRGLRPCEDQEPRRVARTSCFSCRSLQATAGLE